MPANKTAMFVPQHVEAALPQRSSFLLKVYATTMLQLLTTAVVAWLIASLAAPEKDSVFDHEGSSFGHHLFDFATSTPSQCILIVITFALLTELIIHRKDPWWSLHYFEAFAIAMGVWLGLACAYVPRLIVALCLAITFSVFALLAVFSLGLTALGADFGFMEPILAELLNVIVWSAILRLGLGLKKEAIWAVSGIGLWSAYIIFDSNRIARRYADDEYVAGAIDLYVDVINLFLELLSLILKN